MVMVGIFAVKYRGSAPLSHDVDHYHWLNSRYLAVLVFLKEKKLPPVSKLCNTMREVSLIYN